MTGELEAYLQGPEPLTDGDYTSLQRQALGEVLHLSAAVVGPLEARIESDFDVAGKAAQERLEVDKAKVELRFQEEARRLREPYEAQHADIQAEYEGQLSKIKVDAQHKRNRVNQTAVDLERKAVAEQQDQGMEADFVAEGAVTKMQQKRQEAEDAVRGARLQLETMGAQAETWVRLYRQPLPDSDSEARPHDEADGAAAEVYRTQSERAANELATLQRLRSAQLFVGGRPVLFASATVAVAVALAFVLGALGVPGVPSFRVAGPLAGGLAAVLVGLGGRFLWQQARSRVRHTYSAFQEALARARAALERQHERVLQDLEQKFKASSHQKEAELKREREAFETTKANIIKQRATSLREIEEHRRAAVRQLMEKRDAALAEAEGTYGKARGVLEQQVQEQLAAVQQRYDQEMATCRNEYETARRALEERWDKGLACIQALLRRADDLDRHVNADWDQLVDAAWTPSRDSTSVVRFGTFRLDLAPLADSVRARSGSTLAITEPVLLPGLLEFPARCSILLQSPREGRQQAIETLRAVMVRLFTSLPPGRARFTILDPVGLGESFAGFMHAGDYQEALVGGRIWTEASQIQQELEDLTQHMENVIQKYLRNEFETIEQYNEQAGELAEPYRFLVIADFPAHFSEEAARRLSSIVHSGPRCGVHTLIAYDTRQEMPAGVDINDISAGSIHLVHEDGKYVWQDRVLRQFPLVLDSPPSETALTKIMHTVGRAGAESARVEVPFEAIAPTEQQTWSLDSREELNVPLGRTGATRLQNLRLGRGVAQHMLIAGKTGSGKSTLLHVMISNLALWYAPDQVELYLIDFKQGVEFKTYVTHQLPHARAVAIESDREFGLSILQRLDAEMSHRGDLFRAAGTQDIAAYRNATGQVMPRTVLIVDEFQIFFGEDDKLSQDAAVLLEQLVRQGRAFGIHVVLGSQTLGGTFGLARSTIGQMAVRIALQCSEADSQLILDDENVAARLLSRPGEAIYNDVGGRVAGNSPFQTAWLSDATRDTFLGRIAARKSDLDASREPMIVFEGNVPADITDNRLLAASLKQAGGATPTSAPRLWLGAPVTIKEPTHVALRRQSGGNVLIVGQRDEVALNLMAAGLVSLAAQLPARSIQFVILDGSPPDSPLAGTFERVTSGLPQSSRIVPWRSVPEVIGELAREADARVQADTHDAPTIVLFVYGLQRYRMLRRSEDAFGLSFDEEAAPRPDAQFASLLREGPSTGIHVVMWADTLGTLERTVDRQTVREFDHRVLFQMSAADSSNLIDSPVANQLGFHRAVLYSEEQGGFEKFRPYGIPPEEWLATVSRQLTGRDSASDGAA